MDEDDINRFWEKVDRGDEDECWEWQAGLAHGYGQFTVDGEFRTAHRVSHALLEEEPEEQHVLHHCDNKKCVNPSHLYLGGQSENNEDMWERGDVSNRIGESHHLAKLSRKEAERVIELLEEGEQSQYEIADEFGVTQPLISKIANQERWSHLR